MKKILERLMKNKTINLIKIVFINLVLLLSNIPLPSVAASDTIPETGNTYYFDVESGQGGWQTDGLWHITTNRYNSLNHSFWYGDETTKTYNTGTANSGSLISPEIALQGNSQPVLDFWSWYQTEYSENNDIKLVQISVNNGPWIDLLKITDARSTWNKESIDLSAYAGDTIKLRFLFDTVDDKLNNYEGWYVDDISLSLKESALAPTSAPASALQSVTAQVLTCGPCYVAKNGNDNNPGTEQYPWLTITKAANTLVAGQTVYVKEGIYNEKITIKNSGNPGNYITFAVYPGANVTIDGTGISIPPDSYDGLLRIFGASYIKISGFRVMHSSFMGIMITSNFSGSYPSNIIIQNNYVSDTSSSAIFTEDGSYITYDGNEITQAQTMKGLSYQSNEVIDIVRTNNFEIKNNRLYNNANFESICVKDGSSYGSIHDNDVIGAHSAGIYIDAHGRNSQNIDIYRNKIHDSQESNARGIAIAAEVAGGTINNINIYNNLIYNLGAMGINPAAWYSVNSVNNITVENNNVHNNGLVDSWGGGIVEEYSSATNIKIRNNIVSSNLYRQIAVANGANSTVAYNLVHSYLGGTNEIKGTNYQEGDPLFMNANGGDFHLQSASPAIDNGSSVNAPTVDFEGNSRPQGAGYDIGAYEFVPTSVPFDFSLSLNPSSGLVMQGDSISTTATATLLSGTSQPVSFSCSGLPSGASCSFSPSSVNPTASSTLIISTSSTTPTGIYTITVSGTDGVTTKTTTYNLEIVPFSTQFDFSLSLNPSDGSVVQGDSTSTTATATLLSGTPQPVSFSCSGLPSGASCSFNPSSLYPTNSSTLTISTSASTLTGTYSIIINGVSGSITRTANYALKVNTANPSIGEAVDNIALQWTTGGNAPWFGQNTVYYYGNSAAQSGKIGDNQNTWVQTTVTGPGTLKFYWKVSSERYSDTLNFYIDSNQRARISGNTSWSQKTYTIYSGTHTLKWIYTKNRAISSGSDAGWLDKVVYTPRS